MKIKFLILALVLSLTVCALCACGDNEPAPTETPTEAPTTATEPVTEPADKGLFVTDPIDPLLTTPEILQGIELPPDEFGDDVTGIYESHPATDPAETEPVETEPEQTEKPTEAPAPTAWNPDILPEDVFEE